MMVNLKNPRESTKKLVEIINNFSKVAGYKINTHKSSAFLYTSNTSQRQELEREIPFKITLDTTLKDRKAWKTMFRKARELGLQPRIIYPAKLTIYFQRKVWAFNKIDDFQDFVKKRPELNGKFDIQTQKTRET